MIGEMKSGRMGYPLYGFLGTLAILPDVIVNAIIVYLPGQAIGGGATTKSEQPTK